MTRRPSISESLNTLEPKRAARLQTIANRLSAEPEAVTLIGELVQALTDVLNTGLNGGNNVRLAYLAAGGASHNQNTGASAEPTGLAGAEAPEPHSRLVPAGGIPRAAFTAGPWRTDYAGGYGRVGFRAGDTLLGTAHQVGTGDNRIDIAEANARLIAAAPELYEALERLAALSPRSLTNVSSRATK